MSVEEEKKERKKRVPRGLDMILRINDDILLEAGVDEAGRGCLAGRVYVGCVILPDEDKFPDDKYKLIRDSKTLSAKQRDEMRKYIETYAISYNVSYAEVAEIDSINILKATMNTMHRAISGLSIEPEYIAVDGDRFKMYRKDNGEVIPHMLVTGGDNKYRNIAAASILAKTYHDEYVKSLLELDPDLKKYGWDKNMCYGTAVHIKAIKEHGISSHHRKTFGICKTYASSSSNSNNVNDSDDDTISISSNDGFDELDD
jgi:ribonuclease HII